MIRLCVCIILAFQFASSAMAAGPDMEHSYTFRTGDLFRFEYSKSITVKQADENGKIDERRTEIDSVLIIEIKSVSASGAVAAMRFDSPRVVLPLIHLFSAQWDAPEPQPEKSRAVARAIEGAIKAARWNVTLQPDGVLHIDSRTPASLNDWLKDTGNAGGWRKKTQDAMLKLIEQDLALKTPSIDHETLLSFSPNAASYAHTLHPLRSPPTLSATKGDKLHFVFQRQFPGAALPSAKLTPIASQSDVNARVLSITTHEGSAIFDARVGNLDIKTGNLEARAGSTDTTIRNLDSLHEDYSTRLRYESGDDSVEQDVRVEYKLRRLAPAIDRVE